MSEPSVEDKQLIEQIVEHTNALNRTLQAMNPFLVPTENREACQEVVDEVRRLSSDVRVALRNYNKLMAYYERSMSLNEQLQVRSFAAA